MSGTAPGRMECLLLAGGTPATGHPLYSQTQGRPKALLDIAGRPMIQWVLDALAASDAIDRVVLVGDLPGVDLSYPGNLEVAPSGADWTESFFAGVARMDPTPGGLAAFCWSDIPLLTSEMIDRFLDDVGAEPRLVHAGLVRQEDLEGRFGPLPERYLRLREGRFVAADFGVFQPAEAERLRPELEGLAPQRKSAWRQARSVGFGFLLRYLLGRMSIPLLERRLAKAYSISCRVQLVGDPEMALDVDGPENLAICRRELDQQPV